MTVTLLYFAVLRELVGTAEETVSLPVDVRSVHSLRVWLEERYAPLAGRLTSVRFACNEAFVTDDHALAERDVVALIPPVAGG
jgi:molybdopterin synthase sulfur carrier subunit